MDPLCVNRVAVISPSSGELSTSRLSRKLKMDVCILPIVLSEQ